MRRLALALALIAAAGCRGCHPAGPAVGEGAGAVLRGASVATIDAGSPIKFERRVTRQPPLPPQANVAQIFIGFDASPVPWLPPRAKKRTKDEARALADRLAVEARSGADFAALAKRDSDWPLANRNGGALGVITQGASGMMQMVDDKVFTMKDGEVADPYESQLGFHVVKRMPMLRLAHVLIATRDGRDGWPARSREEAKALADKVEGELRDGKSFDDEAFGVSDDLVTAGRGGDLGGHDEHSGLNAAVREAAQRLKSGEVSAPIETAGGFEIVKRLE